MIFRDPRPGISSPTVEATDAGVTFNGLAVDRVSPMPSLYGFEVKFFSTGLVIGTMVMTRQDFVVILAKIKNHG
jgi:hypothetical protein